MKRSYAICASVYSFTRCGTFTPHDCQRLIEPTVTAKTIFNFAGTQIIRQVGTDQDTRERPRRQSRMTISKRLPAG